MSDAINILVVDDDPDNRMQLDGLTISTLGFSVVEAASGEEALARMEGEDASRISSSPTS